ncbi:unnamed protein product [Linum tenue]|uniref:Uncharacterized protein n=1 Tax=Linum tenue TaxID=586396 RepID=A0AAV0RFF6_9ROSI|nr:unnamed protein product [Linum tenue]
MKPSPSLSTLPCFPYIKPMSILLESKIWKGTLPVSSSLRFAFPVTMSFFCFYSVVLSPQVCYDCTWWETNGSPSFPLHNPLLLSSNETLKVSSLLVAVQSEPGSGGRRNRFETGGPTAVENRL